MTEKSDLLAKTKPLADPLRLITILTVIIAIFTGIVTWPASGLWAALGITCGFLSFALLIAPSGKPNAIYLRAFRTDKSTAELRAELAAILGPDFRLSGIRPPREKTSMFMRFLVPGVVAMRYSGSKFMELEAGDDWMARLWKTYQATRLVLIDVRDMTPYVHQEIEMTLQTVGTSRCIFIVNQGKTDSEWRRLLGEIVGPESDPARLQLLDVSPERVSSHQIDSDLKDILKRLPAGVPGELKEGRQFILDHVSQELISKSRHPSVMTVVSAVAALTLTIGLGILWTLIPHLPVLTLTLAVAVLVPSLVLMFVNISQAIARAKRLKRAGHARAALRVWSILLIAFLLFLANPALHAVQLMWGKDAPLVRAKKMAQEVSAVASLRTLSTAEIQYNSTYPDRGYTCSLSALGGKPDSGVPTPDAAQLISEDLASGKKSGYTFNLSNCTKVTVKGQDTYTGFQMTAVPDSVGKTGDRGFCTDESMQIRYDPRGGSNCTISLQ
jgi:type IV pilus assembly protein PilA